jgi:hypothetical protein
LQDQRACRRRSPAYFDRDNNSIPGGINDSSWSKFARHFAATPISLAQSHKAINEGFLEAGSSFVLTF